MSHDSSKKSSTDENTIDNIDQEEVEDIVIEETETASGFSSGGEKKLREKLKKAVAEKQEYLDGWQRAKADLVNAKKSFEEDRKKIMSIAEEGLVMDLLPVLDSFDMAFKNKEAWEAVDSNWRVGVEHIHNQLHSIMKDNAVSRIDAIGQKFDPRLHISAKTVEAEDQSNDDIIESVIQSGYMKGEKVLRPAQVVVFEYSPEEESQTDAD